jgi:hypothetical protein
MIVLAGTGVSGSCSDVCGCPPVLPLPLVVGRVIDESGAGVSGTELEAMTGRPAIARSDSSGHFELYASGILEELLVEITPPAGYVVAASQVNPVLVRLTRQPTRLEIRLQRLQPVHHAVRSLPTTRCSWPVAPCIGSAM